MQINDIEKIESHGEYACDVIIDNLKACEHRPFCSGTLD